MILYNVTTMVATGRVEEWLDWMRKTHMPEIMATGCFTDSRMLRLLEVDDTGGQTFAMQYLCTDREDYERYTSEFATALREAAMKVWGEDAVSFRTLMEVIN